MRPSWQQVGGGTRSVTQTFLTHFYTCCSLCFPPFPPFLPFPVPRLGPGTCTLKVSSSFGFFLQMRRSRSSSCEHERLCSSKLVHADARMWKQEVLLLCVEFNEKGGFRVAFWVATSHEAQPKQTLMPVTHARFQAAVDTGAAPASHRFPPSVGT